MKYWNVVASMFVLLTLGYVGVAAAELLVGKIDFAAFSSAVAPVITGWGGYFVGLLPKENV